MKNWLINLLENLLYKLTDNTQTIKVITNPNLLIEETIAAREIERRLPLHIGDVVNFESEKIYKVEVHTDVKSEVNGKTNCYPVRLKRVVNLDEQSEKTEIVHYQFGSIRELNYYIEKQIHLIKSINKKEFAKEHDYLTLNIEEAHEKALEINNNLNKTDSFHIA